MRLRSAPHQLAVDVDSTLGNLDAAVEQVAPAAAQRHGLAEPQAAVGDDVHERAIASRQMIVRRLLHRRGYRYRVDAHVIAGLPRRADLVFRGRKVAVFIDGCFWHQCPQHGTLPKANARWWKTKLDRNVERDRDTDERLRQAGWTVVRIWEHEIRDDPENAANRIGDAVACAD